MRVGGEMIAGDDEGFALGGLDEVGHAFGDPLGVDIDARDLALEGGGVGGIDDCSPIKCGGVGCESGGKKLD